MSREAFEAARAEVGVIDTMIGFPKAREEQAKQYDFIRKQTHDADSQDWEFPAQYMFKDVPDFDAIDDPVALLVAEMDRFNVRWALLNVGTNPVARDALARHPDRFVGGCSVDPNSGMDGVRHLERAYHEYGARSAQVFPAGLTPQVPINDKKMYPLYAKCVELGIPMVLYVGVPGPRILMSSQEVAQLDEVCWFFPELTFVMRHGAEPWADLAVKLMLKWPNLYYSTSAFAPKYYPADVVHFANTRGADKVMYAGYYPMGLELDRIWSEMPDVPFRDHVWPKFLHENAARVFKLDE